MQSFRQYLTEAKDPDYFAPWHTKDPAQIETILWSRNSGFTTGKATGYTLNKDGTVSITVENAKFYGTRMKTADNKVVIPFKIKSARQMLTLGSGAIDNLSSLWGAPDKVGTLNVASKELDSLEHLFCDARGTIQLNTPKLTKIENCKFINKFDKYIIPFCRYHPYIVSLI